MRTQGHDVVESWEHGEDPGDLALLEHAAAEGRIVVALDSDVLTATDRMSERPAASAIARTSL